jgi:hypothetical protein
MAGMLDFKVLTKTDELIRQSIKSREKVLQRFGEQMWFAATALTRGNPRKVRAPGKPWRRGSGLLRGSILYETDGTGEVALGFGRESFRDVGSLHEEGGAVNRREKGKTKRKFYPARPVLTPAMDRAVKKVAKKWPDLYRAYFEKGA